jgi:Tfp pilus assembly protein PilN
VAIKINLLPREAAPARARAAAVRLPSVSLSGGMGSKLATGLFVLVVLGLLTAGYLAWSEKRQYQAQITTLRAENDRLNAQLQELRVAEEARLDIQRRLDIIGRVAKSQGVSVNIMTTILRSVPQGVWLTSLDVKPQEARVKVETGKGSGSEISRTLDLLEARRREFQSGGGSGQAPAPAPSQTKEVLQLQGFVIGLKGQAFNNFQLADFMDTLRKTGLFADVDFVTSQADRVDQTRLVAFEITASVKL